MIDNYNATTATNGTYTIKRGDHVMDIGNGEYLGEVVELYTRVEATIKKQDGTYVHKLAMSIAPAPKLTPEEAWLKVPGLVMQQIEERITTHYPVNPTYGDPIIRSIYEPDRRAIRHEVYKLLGGAGIKISDVIRENVANTVEQVAQLMGIRVY